MNHSPVFSYYFVNIEYILIPLILLIFSFVIKSLSLKNKNDKKNVGDFIDLSIELLLLSAFGIWAFAISTKIHYSDKIDIGVLFIIIFLAFVVICISIIVFTKWKINCEGRNLTKRRNFGKELKIPNYTALSAIAFLFTTVNIVQIFFITPELQNEIYNFIFLMSVFAATMIIFTEFLKVQFRRIDKVYEDYIESAQDYFDVEQYLNGIKFYKKALKNINSDNEFYITVLAALAEGHKKLENWFRAEFYIKKAIKSYNKNYSKVKNLEGLINLKNEIKLKKMS